MPLPWGRLDTNFYSNPKVLALLAKPRGWQACVAWLSSLAYCAGHGTDGLITFRALPFIHADEEIAALLTDPEHEFWEPVAGGFGVHDYDEFQESNVETQARRARQQRASIKANCVRWHGADCGCWKHSESDLRSESLNGVPKRTPTDVRTDGRRTQ